MIIIFQKHLRKTLSAWKSGVGKTFNLYHTDGIELHLTQTMNWFPKIFKLGLHFVNEYLLSILILF